MAVERYSADTMPVETDCSLPNGEPMAMTHSPTLSLEESPISIGVSLEASASLSLMTARSLEASLPTNSASYVVPSSMVTTYWS